MDVYLVPVGPERYELYCESPEEPPVAPAPSSSGGMFRKLHDRFGQMLAWVEREYERERARRASRHSHHDSLFRRLRSRLVSWVAERVAEQRLLWRLRNQTRVTAFYPSNLDDDRALTIIRRNLAADADRHSRWLVIDGVGLLISGLLIPFPGPNLAGYYFTFRVVGHLLAIRGARQGLKRVEWTLHASPPLEQLCRLGRVPQAERLDRVRAIERELGLAHLARFFERIVGQPA